MNRRNFLKGFLATGAVAALAPLVPVALPTAEATYINLDEMLQQVLTNYRSHLAGMICSSDPFHAFITAKPHIMSGEQLEEYSLHEPYGKSELMVIR